MTLAVWEGVHLRGTEKLGGHGLDFSRLGLTVLFIWKD